MDSYNNHPISSTRTIILILLSTIVLFSTPIRAQDKQIPLKTGPDAPPPELKTGLAVACAGALHAAFIGTLILAPPDNWVYGNLPRRSQFSRSWRKTPTWDDGDPWYTNYVGHPIMGAYFFIIARSTGHSFFESFLFSTANSLLWEYTIEAWFEQPSAPDLLVTSTTGTLIGEGMWWIRNRLMHGGIHGVGEHIALAIVDPLTFIQVVAQ